MEVVFFSHNFVYSLEIHMYFNGLLRNKDINKIEKSHLGYTNFSRETFGFFFVFCGGVWGRVLNPVFFFSKELFV